MATDQEVIRFSRSDVEVVVTAMHSLGPGAGSGGWINIGPWLSDEAMATVPVRSGLGAWFSGRGPHVPMATWMPEVTEGKKPTAAQIGIEHGTGPNALKRLDDDGHGFPDGWVPRQDHAKHGIVAELPSGVALADVVRWLIDAISMLSPMARGGDRWRAVVHRSS